MTVCAFYVVSGVILPDSMKNQYTEIYEGFPLQ